LVAAGGTVLVVSLVRRPTVTPAHPKAPSAPVTVADCGSLITRHGYVYSIKDQHQALPCVAIIQRILKTMGLPVAVTGYYNAQTEAAVKLFQRSVSLPATGVVDAATWQRMTQGVPATTSSAQVGTPTPSGPIGAHPPAGYRYAGYYQGIPIYVPEAPATWDYAAWGPIPVANRVVQRQCAWIVIRRPILNAATGQPVPGFQRVASYSQAGRRITAVTIRAAYGKRPFVADCNPYVNWPGQLLF
jgi:peptidoglycan hydrolase-like protein with peptidoglycan-binding domain